MATWEYKSVGLERTGKQQDQFGITGSGWTYSPWVISGTNQAWLEGLQQLGREGWEAVSLVPSDFWAEGSMMRASSHGVRAISYIVLLKRPQPQPEALPVAVQDQPEAVPVAAPSVADELAKLVELEKSGVLTRWELNAQKAKLLGT